MISLLGEMRPKTTAPTKNFKLPKMRNIDAFRNRINLHVILMFSNATLIKIIDSSCYHCAFCNEHFLDPATLKHHNLRLHRNKQSIMTHCCAKMFKNAVKLDITGLNCKICSEEIESLAELMIHLKNVHRKLIFSKFKSQLIPFKFETEYFTCIECKQEYRTFKLLQEHMSSHFANYICEICGASFILERLRTAHQKIHEESTKEFKCTLCKKTFPTLGKRKMHIQRMHKMGGKVSKCNFCHERFADYWKKMEHLVEVHGMPPLESKCETCGIVFKNRGVLNRHVKKDHPNAIWMREF